MRIRPAAVAGSWYPRTAPALAAAVDHQLADADRDAAPLSGELTALIAPHAGLLYSGPVAAHAYRLLRNRTFDVAVLVGPSHYVGFEGVAIYSSGGFETPYGVAPIDADCARAIAAASPVVIEHPQAHAREHSLEMQLPFFKRVFPHLPVVPVLIGYQDRSAIEGLAGALADAFAGRRVLLVASTDLSHYFDAATAAGLDARVQDCVTAFDPERLLALFEQYPEGERGRYVACGGGAAIAVMMAARTLGASAGRVLKYAHSGEISGDNHTVVGYMAAAFGCFQDAEPKS
jgi:MEMO1 family protein